MKNKTRLRGLKLLLTAAVVLIPIISAADDVFFDRPLDSIYFDAHGNFDRNRYVHDLDSIAFETSVSLKSTGEIVDCIINPFREPDTLREIGWDRFNRDPAAANIRGTIVNSAFWESRVDTITYVVDTFVCADFTLATQIEFSGFLRPVDESSTAHALYDTIVTPNRFNVPSYYVSISTPEFAHAVCGFMLGNDISDFDDWYLVEPQNDRSVLIGDWNLPLNTTVINVYQPIYYRDYQDMRSRVLMLSFLFNDGNPVMTWFNSWENIVATRLSETDVLPFLYLEQNFPNPFNASTTIIYNLPVGGHVRLKIYNILGQCVRTVVDSYQAAGGYSWEIDMSENASGIYLYRLETSGESFCRKMVLAR